MESHDSEYEYIIPNSITFSKDGKTPSKGLKINAKDIASKYIQNTEKDPVPVEKVEKLCSCVGLGEFAYGFGFFSLGLAAAGAVEMDALMYAIMLMNGGVGMVTMGLLQLYIGHGFYSAVFLVNGFYLCIVYLFNHLAAKVPEMQVENSALCVYNAFFCVYGLFLLVSSFKINIAFVIQMIAYELFLLLSSVGYAKNLYSSVKAGGVFAVVSGAAAFYLGCDQILRKGGTAPLLFCGPLKPQNGLE